MDTCRRSRGFAGWQPGTPKVMTDFKPTDPPPSAPVPPPTSLPDVDSPPAEQVLGDVPSKEEIIEQTQSADEIVGQQPSPEELLRGRRRD